MTTRFRKLVDMSWRERRTLACALVALPAAAVCLRGLGFNRTHAIFAALARDGTTAPPSSSDVRVARAARAVAVASRRGPYRANCLQQSIVLWWLLRLEGIAGELRIGVSKASGEMLAHAWVDVDGCALNEADDVRERFAPFEGAVIPPAAGSR